MSLPACPKLPRLVLSFFLCFYCLSAKVPMSCLTFEALALLPLEHTLFCCSQTMSGLCFAQPHTPAWDACFHPVPITFVAADDYFRGTTEGRW